MDNERRDSDWVNPPDDDERDDYEPDVDADNDDVADDSTDDLENGFVPFDSTESTASAKSTTPIVVIGILGILLAVGMYMDKFVVFHQLTSIRTNDLHTGLTADNKIEVPILINIFYDQGVNRANRWKLNRRLNQHLRRCHYRSPDIYCSYCLPHIQRKTGHY
jgi:hypothetical protein